MTEALLLALGILVIAVVVFHLPRTHRDSNDLEDRLDREVQKILNRNQSTGVVIGVYQRGRTFFRGYGSLERNDPRQADTKVFEIASVTKVFTGSLLQILASEGVVKLESTLDDIFGDEYDLPASVRDITLRQLGTHRSGLPRLPKSFLEKSSDPANPYADLTLADLFGDLRNAGNLKGKGKVLYSNLGMGLLGHALEHATGETLEALMRRTMFDPLEMTMTGFAMTPDMDNALVAGHTANGSETGTWDMPVLPGAGALRSNVSDLVKFIEASVEPTGTLYSQLKRTHPADDDVEGLAWAASFGMTRFWVSKDTIWHNGMVGGHTSYIAVDPKARIGFVVLSNHAKDITIPGTMMMREARRTSLSIDQNVQFTSRLPSG